jgi:hypothetical protein
VLFEISRRPSGCQHEKNQPGVSATARASVLRKEIASSIASPVRSGPPFPRIMCAATSFEAVIAYCGEVEACIMNASLKRSRSTGRRPFRTWM